MKQEKISIIIPVWKPDIEHLTQCLESIVKQTYDNLEILIIYRKAEESENDFFNLINNYHDDNRLKVIMGKSKGFVNALNEGITNATGELIGRIDGDDYCEVNRFEKQLEFKYENHLNLVSCWAYRISYDGKILGKVEVPVTHKEIRKKNDAS